MDYRRHHGKRRLAHWISAPFIYSVIVPVLFLDLVIELYHRVCFPLYRIPYVRRGQYIRIDRQKLAYLTWYEKLNCMYCGYVNGQLRFASMIAQESERYWCGIMHEGKGELIPPPHQKDFLPYGDEAAYRAFLAKKEHKEEFLAEKNDADPS